MASIYQMVTDRIIEQMKQGIIPWQQPWVGGAQMAINYESRKAYSLLNQFLLGKGGEWLTWKQIEHRKGKVKKGAKSRFVVYYHSNTQTEEDPETGEVRVKESYPVLKWYRVFHINDTEGIDTKIEPVIPNPDIQPIERAEKVANDYVAREDGLTLINNKESAEAYYSLTTDTVVVPHITQYAVPEEYYSTLFHELTHSTMPEGRCNRKADNNIKRFGDKDYSREELVAEQGAAMILSFLGIECEKAFRNSVAYIQHWMKALQNDEKMIVWAASRAEKAANYILGDNGVTC